MVILNYVLRFTKLDFQKTCFENDFTAKVNTSAALKWADRRRPAQSPGGQRKSESRGWNCHWDYYRNCRGIAIGVRFLLSGFDQQHMKAHFRRKWQQDWPIKIFRGVFSIEIGVVILLRYCEPWAAAAAKCGGSTAWYHTTKKTNTDIQEIQWCCPLIPANKH